MLNLPDLHLLDELTKESKPVWGAMTAQHMVEHLYQSVQLSNGSIELDECMSPDEKLPILKRILMSDRPLPKNFVNTVIGEGVKPLIFENLEKSILGLKKELEKVVTFFEQTPEATPMNPTFGPLNKEEWIQFHKKHFQHHFSQFGLLK